MRFFLLAAGLVGCDGLLEPGGADPSREPADTGAARGRSGATEGDTCPQVPYLMHDSRLFDPVVEIFADLATNTVCSDTWLVLRTDVGDVVDLRVCDDGGCTAASLGRLTYLTRTGVVLPDETDVSVVVGDLFAGEIPERVKNPSSVRFMCHDLGPDTCSCVSWQ